MKVRGGVFPSKYWKPNHIYLSDSRLINIESETVDLIVTSPPYCVGKSYEEELKSFEDWQNLISDCLPLWWRVLRKGGKLCVNLANIGRKPYVSLVHSFHNMIDNLNGKAYTYMLSNEPSHNSSILQLDLFNSSVPHLEKSYDKCFVLRGEIIWDKGASAGVSTAWGSYGQPSNPSLRDVHEYILVYVKPNHSSISNKDCYKLASDSESGYRPIVDYLPKEAASSRFAALTKSIWNFPTVSAKSIGHEAPFPEELPRRCIELFVWPGGLVYDPFIGSGTTAVACINLNHNRPDYPRVRYIGNDHLQMYVNLANTRIAEALNQR